MNKSSWIISGVLTAFVAPVAFVLLLDIQSLPLCFLIGAVFGASGCTMAMRGFEQ